MRLATPLVLLVLAAALLGGCGSSSSSSGGGSGSGSGETTAPASGSGVPSNGEPAPVGASAKSCETDAVGAGELRAVGVSCGQARQVMYAWQRARACAPPSGASRGACTARSYRCLGTRTARGLTVGCARPGASIAFTVRRR